MNVPASDNPAYHALSTAAYTGTDTRSVAGIIADDDHALSRLGVSKKHLTAALQHALDTAMGMFGAPARVGFGLTASWYESKGMIPSPLGDGRSFEKGEALIESTEGDTLIITPLSLHLMQTVGFFQGMGSRYRVDPAVAVRVFGLKKDSHHA